MPQGFKGQICVFCGVRLSTRTGDHVLARSLFLEHRRGYLPKVPACTQCNGEKSRLEHYLATVLPFGGRHIDASANLEQLVPRRLENNASLHREIGERRETVEITNEDGKAVTGTTSIPIRGEALFDYVKFVVKGLLWHHWQTVLLPGFGVRVIAPTNAVVGQFVSLVKGSSGQRVTGDLGSGTVTYEGAQGSDYPELSVWAISIYGGITVSDERSSPDEQSNILYAVTAKDEFFERPVIASIFGNSAEFR